MTKPDLRPPLLATPAARAAGWCAAAALCVGLAGCGWWSSGREEPPATYAADALDEYLPEDAGAVYVLNQREALKTRSGRSLLASLRQFLDKEKIYQPWLSFTDADPVEDVDAARFAFCPPDLDQPLVLLRGRFDAGRFAVGPKKLREASDGPFHFYEAPVPHSPRVTRLAPAGDTLAASDSRPRFLAALRYAAAPGPFRLQDARLAELLKQVDRGQSIWFAVSFDKLGRIARFKNFGLELVLRPLLDHAESVRGGVVCGEDVRAEFVFLARGDADADALATALQSSCIVARGAHQLPGIDRELLPMLRLFGTGEVSRDGKTVVVRCRLPGDQIDP
jgi:hypothetical protein